MLKEQNDPNYAKDKEWEKAKKISEVKVKAMMERYRQRPENKGKKGPIAMPLYKIDKQH